MTPNEMMVDRGMGSGNSLGTDLTIDALGLRCPLPVLRLEKALRTATPGQRIVLLSDDPVAAIDVPHACAAGGHEVVSIDARADGVRRFVVRVAGAVPAKARTP